jgi:tetrahydromethanopterin S-methyltransferase subunit E
MVELVIGAVAAVSTTLLVVSYFGLILRDDPYEAPTWVAWGLVVGAIGMAGSALALWIAKFVFRI